MCCFRTGALGQPSACANYMFFDHDRIGCITVLLQQKGAHIKIKVLTGRFLSVGCSYLLFIHQGLRDISFEWRLPINIWALARNPNFQQLISQYVPTHYSWYLFFVGELLMLIGMFHVFRCAQPKRWGTASINSRVRCKEPFLFTILQPLIVLVCYVVYDPVALESMQTS